MVNDEICIKVECFNLLHTLECGQCFRWKKTNNLNEYIGVIQDRVICVRQEDDKLYISSNNIENLEKVVCNYFDLNCDYKKIENEISKIDINILSAIKNSSGIRILNQAAFETIISYIISANNNIPRISRAIEDISKKYGEKVQFKNENYYLFPTCEDLKDVTKDEFRKCGVGFRDKYIKNVVNEILIKDIDVEMFKNLNINEIRDNLIKFQGVGPKVSDCILLFAYDKKQVFPIDVWVERVMNRLYFKGSLKNVRKTEILQYANENFGEYAGIIQQHLFYNIRGNMFDK